MPAPPYEDLPQITLSINQFTETAQTLASSEDGSKFVPFVLAGRLLDDEDIFEDVEKRVFVNPIVDAECPPGRELKFSRDYDSVIGVSSDLPYLSPLAVFPVPPFKDTLKRTNHVNQRITRHDGTRSTVPLHQIPNFALGKISNRHVARVFFPSLYRPHDTNRSISQETFTIIYDQCLRPVLQEVIPEHQAHWPVSYAAALAQYRGDQGQLHLGTVDVPAYLLIRFAERLREEFNNHQNLKDALFVHEFRGVKSATVHDPSDADDVAHAYRELLEGVNVPRIDMSQWHLDVGLEIRHEGHVLQWRNNSHLHLLRHLLPSAPEIEIEALHRSNRRFQLDTAAHMEELAGFRCAPGNTGKEDRVSYINVYTTDKSVSYQLHHGVFHRRRAYSVLPAAIDRFVADIDIICDTILACSGQGRDGQEGSCRIEARVPLNRFETVLLGIPYNTLRIGMVSYPLTTWWLFKFYRLTAISWVLKDLKLSSSEARTWKPSLLLGAILPEMFNALFSRPVDLPAERTLAKTCGFHVLRDDEDTPTDEEGEEDEETGGQLVSRIYGQGLYFISDIINDRSPRLHASVEMNEDLLVLLYRRRSFTELCSEFTATVRATHRHRVAHPNRIHNRIKATVPIEFIRENPEPVHDFRLAERGIRLREKVAMAGPDVDALRTQNDDFDEQGSPQTPDEYMAKIWRQIPYDIMTLGPNKKLSTDSSHVLLPKEDRDQITLGHFKSLDLSPFFERVQARTLALGEWREKVFDRYFPPKQAKFKKMQNFSQATYFTDWKNLMSKLSTSDAKFVRNQVFEEFRKLAWLPHPTGDRMWCTSTTTSSFWTYYGPGRHCACPRIAINAEVARGQRLKIAPEVHDEAPVAEGYDEDGDDL